MLNLVYCPHGEGGEKDVSAPGRRLCFRPAATGNPTPWHWGQSAVLSPPAAHSIKPPGVHDLPVALCLQARGVSRELLLAALAPPWLLCL